jgi:hypothetical protein
MTVPIPSMKFLPGIGNVALGNGLPAIGPISHGLVVAGNCW